ncbi:MAG: hypothetical protein QG670_854 [Thermoproteota archaeon]|nr:hypothetical protein [Thermoproteota archaeon]
MKNAKEFDCDYCESKKDLKQNRNCGWEQSGECSGCGEIKFEDAIRDPKDSKFYCPICGGRVRWGRASEFILGNYRTPGCPKSMLTERAVFLIQLVDWSDEVGILPTADHLLDESLFYFELRNFIISERNRSEEEMMPKEKK